MHAIAYDELHDEIVVPQQFAQAIMTFRGGSAGEEPPLRVIQGPLTQLRDPDQLAIDPVHNEIYVPDGDHVLVFPRMANGNVAPLRVLQGPLTGISSASAAAVDPVHHLLLVSRRSGGGDGDRSQRGGGIAIFNRTDQGNVQPRAVLGGPKTSLSGGRVFVYPPRGQIIAVAGSGGVGAAAGEMAHDRGFVGVWSIHDQGDTPPRWMIGGPKGMLLQIRGVALDPKNKSVIVTDKRLNAILTYSFPEIF